MSDLERDAAVMPFQLRLGAVLVLLQCAAMFAYIISLLVVQFRGVSNSVIESESGAAAYVALGTAVFLLIIFGFITWVAVETLRGRPRSQGAILLIEAILLGVALYMFRGGMPWLGAVTFLSAACAIACFLHPDTRRFHEARYALRQGR